MHADIIDLLSGYLDDELDRATRRRVEGHLAQCAECARVHRDLAAIVTGARDYAGSSPAADLWPGIAAGIERGKVVALRPESAPVRRFRWAPLAIAAAGLLAAGLGGGWYVARSGRTPAAPATVAARPEDSRMQTVSVTATTASPAYSAAVADLERTLATHRSRLDTTTVRVVEESLRTIDRAIAEAQAAIQRDPANGYLNDQIAANMRRKIALLRLAARAASKET